MNHPQQDQWWWSHAEGLRDRVKASTQLYVLAIAGYPGAGKSTLSKALVEFVEEFGINAAILAMDGFHYRNAELERRGIRQDKGMPHSFDLNGFEACLHRVIKDRDQAHLVPVYDRDLHEPVDEGQVIERTCELLVVEGNYLLCEVEGWSRLRSCWKERWFLQIDRSLAIQRLLSRHLAGGKHQEQALKHMDLVDLPNMDFIDRHTKEIDYLLRVPLSV